MRIFCVGTGRCGTSTFYQACRHMTNYTVGHESAAGLLNPYICPDQHIEVDAHLSMFMGQVLESFPDAKWVHLVRERAACVDSLASQSQVPLDCFARHWMQVFQANPRAAAEVFYDCVNANIRAMLGTVPHMTIAMESAASAWPEFWDWIGADGDFESSVGEWDRKYNSRMDRGRDRWV